MSEKYEASTNDWVANKSRFFAAWGLPTFIMLLTWLMQLTPLLTGILWMGALSWMGVACLRNAHQCGRIHCFFSGPYFLLSAVLALATGMQWIQILSFNELGLFLLIGTLLVCVLPEVFWGRYKSPREK
ncbi:hypothetical protein [uncultured Paraglaciecola sp.]|uniref:hypothetical protein n=1 Tax=uncultured Paraglaciecola sp. TaxID=1765024 RepID=UPI00261B9C32|nr:hypothetical protein [uncultured Paraglaciecola sp.]